MASSDCTEDRGRIIRCALDTRSLGHRGSSRKAARPCHFLYPRSLNTALTCWAAGKRSDIVFHLDQDARNADSSDPSSTENSTGIISFVVTLPFKSLSPTTSC
jgi:hypothetical protein